MFNPYAAGKKRYGGGRDAPSLGPNDPLGYAERDAKASARRNAVLRRMQKERVGNYAHPDSRRWY